ncbi:MAG: dephospho-CoA kinase [Candidatus Omnitrophica bacterium]|nr:dephospho-CoA kinase [Candidatus Omnitrophota bacterium]
MRVIGLTGGVGTGKSTVARLFGELGCAVIDADRITHELMRPGTPVWRAIRKSFGEGILDSRRRIDRRRLGEIAFGDPGGLKRLTRIIHPAVRRRILREIRRIALKNPRGAVVLDVPLLLEAGSAYRADALVVVSAPSALVARRLAADRGWGAGELKKRQGFQMPLRKKEQLADFVVKNKGDRADTRRQVLRIWKQMKSERKDNG